MNWTGGRLQRHSGKSSSKGALTSRQKEHFAKVQANLRSGGPKRSPITWSIFDRSRVDSTQRSELQSHDDSRDHERPSSKAAVKSGRESLRLGEGKRYHEYREPILRQTDVRNTSMNTRSSSPEITNQRSISNDERRNTTPSPLRIKRERGASVELSRIKEAPKQAIHESEEELMEMKRRRLLRKADWAGLNTIRRPQMMFNSSRHNEEVGRRRKLTDGHQARYAKNQAVIRSPFATRREQILDSLVQESSQGPARNDVRISIGGRVVPPGLSSSSRPSKAVISTPRMMSSHRSQTLSSDEMLLDNVDGVNFEDEGDGINSDKFLSAFEARCYNDANGKDRQLASGAELNRNLRTNNNTHSYKEVPQERWSTPFPPKNRNSIPDDSENISSPFSRTAIKSVCNTGMKQPVPIRLNHPVLRLSSPQCNSSTFAQERQCKYPAAEIGQFNDGVGKPWVVSSSRSQESGKYDQHNSQINYRTESTNSEVGTTAAILKSRNYGLQGRGDENEDHESSLQWNTTDLKQNEQLSCDDEYDSGREREAISHNLGDSPGAMSEHPWSDNPGHTETETEWAQHMSDDRDQASIQVSERTSSTIPWDSPKNFSTPDKIELPQLKPMQNPQESSLHSEIPVATLGLSKVPESARFAHQDVQAVPRRMGLAQPIKSIASTIPPKEPQDNKDQNEIWMKFVFGGSSEDEDTTPRKDKTSGFEPKAHVTSSSSIHANPPTEIHDDSLPMKTKGKEHSPTFSTFAHNSLDSESPLQPKYVASGRRNNYQLHKAHVDSSPSLSTYTHQLMDSGSSTEVHTKGNTLYYRTSPRVNRHIPNFGGFSQDINPVTSSTQDLFNSSSSGPDSVSMVALADSQPQLPTSTQGGPAFDSQQRIVFTKPRPFVGSKANLHQSPSNAMVRIGRGGAKAIVNEINGQATSDDIEDD